MTIIRGNAATPFNGADTRTVTWGTNPVAGQKVIVMFGTTTTETITSVIDNGTTPITYTLDAIQNNATLNHTVYIYRADNITLPGAGSYTVTITASNGHTISGSGVAYSGAKTGAPTATNVTGLQPAPGSTSVDTGSVTAAAAGALYVGLVATDSAVNDSLTLTSSGWVQQANWPNGAVYTPVATADKIDAAGPAGTDGTWTLAANHGWLTAIAVYDAVAPTLPGVQMPNFPYIQSFRAGPSR